MRYAVFRAFVWQIWQVWLFLLFHFILHLLIIFMVLINIFKIELINASGNYLLNLFSIKNFFYQLNCSLFITFSFVPDQGLHIKWTKILYRTLGKKKIHFLEWLELDSCFFMLNVVFGKKLAIPFLVKAFSSSFACKSFAFSSSLLKNLQNLL